ncbi:MAG: 4-aminobutyrate--2-oxoglutarate transaminase [Gammaproteobacteria bacterium]|nr:4-aminobutyrate--2-oxoglutarate transaminase [Gammaproteobacteria bacterium]MDH4313208.1 4-aminobutyrate--2-oxoglutarate transaminase [Gammaproteobacteria bacterium]MDH5215637.1 4-aminobutyrate--2-oxoglutarate transaminase [Gammaproteobacteria bacterium]
MSTNKQLLERRQAAVARGVGTQHTVFAQKTLGAEVWDVEGKRYIDLASGIAVNNVGHNHPKVVAAVKAQLDKFSHPCFQVTPYEIYVALAERLNKLAPGKTPKKTLFLTTGAEAVENAIKIARYHTKRTGVIAFSGAFHGRTMMGMALTGKVAPYKAGFGPFPPDIYHIPYPIEYHGKTAEASLQALEALFKSDIEPGRVAAMIIEPVQGEGGFYAAPASFLKALRRICDEHGIVLVADEIQTGFARTGKFFAIEHSGIEPDLITVAKSLGGGMPLSGVIGKADIMDAPMPGGLGGTYGGPPVGCAAGLAVLDIIEDEKLCERALAIGKKIAAWGAATQKSTDSIGEVRTTGAMCAIELVKGGDADQPDPDLTKAVVAEALKKGVILLSCGARANVIRFLPALVISDKLLDEALATVREVLVGLSNSLKKAS